MKLRSQGLKLALTTLFFTMWAFPTVHAEEISLDALTPGSLANCNSPINGLYGNTFVAGSTTSITKIEIVTQSYMTAPANSIRIRVSSGAPASTTGTVLGTFTQSSVASYPADGSDKYLITFTGAANVTQGTTYYLQASYVSTDSSQNWCLSSSSYTATTGWSLPKSGSSYIDVISNGTFTWFAYHKLRITTGEIITSPTFSALQLPSNGSFATYGTTISISATVAAPSRITFFANNKRITKCIKVQTSGVAPNITAICNWKPTQRGSVVISAQAVPNDPLLTAAKSSNLIISVNNRLINR